MTPRQALILLLLPSLPACEFYTQEVRGPVTDAVCQHYYDKDLASELPCKIQIIKRKDQDVVRWSSPLRSLSFYTDRNGLTVASNGKNYQAGGNGCYYSYRSGFSPYERWCFTLK